MPVVGQPAPDFELLNQDGQPVRLSDFRGKKVVIFAYPKAGTSGCTTQACGFRDEFPRIESGNAVVLGLSPDQPKDLLKWNLEQRTYYAARQESVVDGVKEGARNVGVNTKYSVKNKVVHFMPCIGFELTGPWLRLSDTEFNRNVLYLVLKLFTSFTLTRAMTY